MDSILKNNCSLIEEKLLTDYEKAFHSAQTPMTYPLIHPGAVYVACLWDWDSWLYNIALRQILKKINSEEKYKQAQKYEQGCVLNFLSFASPDEGWIPFVVAGGQKIEDIKPKDIYSTNMHKPVLAQHAAFLSKEDNDVEWIKEKFEHLQAFVNNYIHHHRHKCGLYYWQNDIGIGVDNDPTTYFRPNRSSGSIYLNCLMYKELRAMEYLCEKLSFTETSTYYKKMADELHQAIISNCWDEKDSFFYSVDLNLLPNENITGTHRGMPRHYDCLIQRIGVWTGFMGLWAKLASQEQAERIVKENYLNPDTFNCLYGIRSLSKMEKMYFVGATGNPSPWLGPVWIISNYMTFRGLLNYGFDDLARELAIKTISLLGKDLKENGDFHECYYPENGQPVMNKGFLSWNALAMNMISWLENSTSIEEF